MNPSGTNRIVLLIVRLRYGVFINLPMAEPHALEIIRRWALPKADKDAFQPGTILKGTVKHVPGVNDLTYALNVDDVMLMHTEVPNMQLGQGQMNQVGTVPPGASGLLGM